MSNMQESIPSYDENKSCLLTLVLIVTPNNGIVYCANRIRALNFALKNKTIYIRV